jgi:NADPH:quinone reductase
MYALKFSRFGNPREVLTLQELDPPQPADNEVLIKMLVRPINPSDLLTLQGLYAANLTFPATPGYEGMGEIAALGSQVTGYQVGQRVIPLLDNGGTWQEYVVASPLQLIPVPPSMNNETAAQFIVNPLTAWVMMFEELRLKSGDWLLQTAAGSTLGQMVIQLAKLHGVKTINVVRRQAQVAEIKAIGGDEVISTDTDNLVEIVRQLTDNKGVDYAIDAVGGATGASVVGSLGRYGTMLIYGLLSLQPMPLDYGPMIFRSLNVRGFWLADWLRSTAPEKQQAVIKQMMTLLATGQVVPPVAAQYPLTEFLAAVEHAERVGRNGKVLLVG